MSQPYEVNTRAFANFAYMLSTHTLKILHQEKVIVPDIVNKIFKSLEDGYALFPADEDWQKQARALAVMTKEIVLSPPSQGFPL